MKKPFVRRDEGYLDRFGRETLSSFPLLLGSTRSKDIRINSTSTSLSLCSKYIEPVEEEDLGNNIHGNL